jgi:hypothetical protein
VTGTLLWLIALAVVSLIAAIVLRRMASLAGGTRELERFQADAVSINERLAATVEPLVAHLDEVRRGARDPAEIRPELDAARAGLRGLGKEARAITAPPALADRAQQLAWEVDRAVRAADMAGHGVATMGGGRGRHVVSTEAEVALKRGTLGLRHAREAVKRIMMDVARLSPAEVRAMPVAAAGALPGGIVTPPTDEEVLSGVEEPPPA